MTLDTNKELLNYYFDDRNTFIVDFNPDKVCVIQSNDSICFVDKNTLKGIIEMPIKIIETQIGLPENKLVFYIEFPVRDLILPYFKAIMGNGETAKFTDAFMEILQKEPLIFKVRIK